jgi:hypothetical protein
MKHFRLVPQPISDARMYLQLDDYAMHYCVSKSTKDNFIRTGSLGDATKLLEEYNYSVERIMRFEQ